ncbi:hypothetical protein V1525DRAFT_396766 [Lipomyces kononenkoae]|uniref:Uncharacterized protein n=1 Tax=Lipomyces kononenkoae TaxID=34357 RepID=A0ACC3TAZ6_LIPKO
MKRSTFPRISKSDIVILNICIIFALLLWLRLWHTWTNHELLQKQHPRLRKTVFEGTGTGGRWHIPSKWLKDGADLPKGLKSSPKTVLEAAHLAFYLARSQSRYIANSSIPLILHQSWYSMTAASWSPLIQDYVESWLTVCAGDRPPEVGLGHDDIHQDEMAYIIWDNSGMDLFVKEYEGAFWESYAALPIPVEQVDVFRVAVLRWFGGVYSDIDTKPLRHPVSWIEPADIDPWIDHSKGRTYSLSSAANGGPLYPPPSHSPAFYSMLYEMSTNLSSKEPGISAIVGLEADLPPEGDKYWRAGYEYPVQITQWTLALAPHHPISSRFVSAVDKDIKMLQSTDNLNDAFAVDLTGPVQFTRVIKEWLESVSGLRWNALTGLHDGGRSKTVKDVLVLPITGFSPGRGIMNNMGSKPVTDRSARVLHGFQGSWRGSFDLVPEFGKMCRTFFGKCRTMSKTPRRNVRRVKHP